MADLSVCVRLDVAPVHVYPTSGPAHVTDGTPCWCEPERICSECRALAPCIHGASRTEVIVHKEAS